MTLPGTIKHSAAALLLFFILAFPAGRLVAAEPAFPRPTGAVNDFANVIKPEQRDSMERLAREVLEKTGTAVVVATVKTTGDRTADDYATRLYESWGIGKKGEDKGVLILLTMKERRVRIETGYGVEGILPDGVVGEILRVHAIPSMKRGEYGQGLSGAMTAVCDVILRNAATAGQGTTPKTTAQPEKGFSLNPLTLVLLVALLALALFTETGRQLLLMLFLFGSNRGDRYSGGSWGGGSSGGFGGFSGGFGGFGGGSSGGGGAGEDF